MPKEFPENYLDYFTAMDNFLKLGFAQEEVEEAIKALVESGKITYDRFFEEVELEWDPKHYKAWEKLGGCTFTKKEYRGEWSREVQTTGAVYRVPCRFQSLIHEHIVRFLMNKRFPWFREFLWAIYAVDKENYDIYLHTKSPDPDGICVGSMLYVPIKALLTKDWSLIDRRHRGYMTSYYRDRTNNEGKLFLPMALAPLEAPEALLLKQRLEE